MTIYSHKDVKILVGNGQICCTDVSIDYRSNLDPEHNIKSKSSFRTVAVSPPQGSLTLTYFHTGNDPLMEHMFDVSKSISVNIAGLFVNSGYLNNYSIDFEPHSRVQVKARLDFFEDIKGTVDPDKVQTAIYPRDLELINTSSADFIGGKNVFVDNILSLKYSYSVSVQPEWVMDKAEPHSVHHGRHRTDCELSLYNYDLTLPVTGLRENFKINLNNKNGETLSSLTVDGQILEKRASFQVGDNVKIDYKVGGAKLGVLDGSGPTISSFATRAGVSTNGAPPNVAKSALHSLVDIQGNNFSNVENVFVGEFPCKMDKATIYSSDFRTDYTDGWAGINSSVQSVDGGPSHPYGFLKSTSETTHYSHYIYKPNVFEAGKKYRVRGTIWINNAEDVGRKLDKVVLGNADPGPGFLILRHPMPDWQKFSTEITTSASLSNGHFYIFMYDGDDQVYTGDNDDYFYIKDIVVEEIFNQSSTSLTVQLPSDVISGYVAPFTVITQGAIVNTSSSFNITGGLTDMHGF